MARYASMTVPAHKALNIRYNHNDLKRTNKVFRTNGDWVFYGRDQGSHPRELNLAAALSVLDPWIFWKAIYDPRMDKVNDFINPQFPTSFYYAAELNRFAYQIGDAIHLSRPSKAYSDLLSQSVNFNTVASLNASLNSSSPGPPLHNLRNWLKNDFFDPMKQPPPPPGGGPPRPYSYYQFMESFSSTPLQPEPEKFNVNGIRDEVVKRFAYIDNTQPGFPLTFRAPHGLESGDKLEWDGVSAKYAPPISDPITFKSIHDGLIDDAKRERWMRFANLGEVQTEVPHRLLNTETVRVMIGGVDGLTLLSRNAPNVPWTAIPDTLALPIVGTNPADGTFLKFAIAPAERAWGRKFSGVWRAIYKTNFSLYTDPPGAAPGDLPDEFTDATLTITYRYLPRAMDPIPYFVKKISPTSVSLHRSAELGEDSRVIFEDNLRLNPTSRFSYNAGNGVFTCQGPNMLFRERDYVRFVIPPDDSGMLVTAFSGATINKHNTFLLKQFASEPPQFKLFYYEDPSLQLKMNVADDYILQVVHRFKEDRLTAAMETMAGLMLNESLDTIGDGAAAQHRLGDQPLYKQEDPGDPGNPQPFPLEMGIGGHTKPLGSWHYPQKGIAWGHSLVPENPTGKGRYTREVERIVQVAANIADLYSGYRGLDLPITGSEMLYCKSEGILQKLPFGIAARDQSVSARITQSLGGYCGMVLSGGFEVRCVNIGPNRAHVELWIPDPDKPAGKLVAKSGNIPMEAMGAFVEYRLQAECEGGRRVKVTLNEREILDYEHSGSEPFFGKAALLANAPGNVVFTDLKPEVMPAELISNWSSNFPRSNSVSAADILPTTWRGVFRRDENNNVYLTGFQRWQTYTVGNPAISWYQRNGPVVIGVKDRSTPVSPGSPVLTEPGKNLSPAFTEFSLRTVYDRETKALYGRLSAEVKAPVQPAIQVFHRSRLQAKIKDATYTLVYRNKNGVEKTIQVPAVEGVQFKCDNPLVFTSGYANSVMSPMPAYITPRVGSGSGTTFAGLQRPDRSRNTFWKDETAFARLTIQGINLSGAQQDPGNLTGYSLTDIRVDGLTIHVEGEVRLADGNQRTVDYINGDLTLSGPAHFANVEANLKSLSSSDLQAQRDQPQYTFNEWTYKPDYPESITESGSRRCIRNNAFYSYKKRNNAYQWVRSSNVEMRKLDISWQVKDPLVNSHGSDYMDKTYSPGGHLMYVRKDLPGKRNPNKPQLLRRWLPQNAIYFPLIYNIDWAGGYPEVSEKNPQPRQDPLLPNKFPGHTGWDEGWPITGHGTYKRRLGVNLGLPNEVAGPWDNGRDSAIQDPNVRSHADWRFPDISRGRIENVGWLGQVHRGTPWQTLYLKSRVPGLIDNITAVNFGVVTAPNHNLRQYDEVQLIGKCPPEWRLLNFAVDGGVDPAGNIKEGQLRGFVEVLNVNQFKIWPEPDESGWVAGADIVPVENVADTQELATQNIGQWQNWAGSSDTLPANDRRLLEVFSVGNGAPVRGRFSVNNDSNASWSAALSGLSVPHRLVISGGTVVPQPRILGANDPAINWDWGVAPHHRSSPWIHLALSTIPKDAFKVENPWTIIVEGINAVRGEKPFTRVTDILAAPELTDGSPYLPYVWMNTAPGFKDELDLERIPMQLMSLLRVDEQPVYVTYIFTEKLRPAFQVNIQGKSFPAKGQNGTILNYEVAGQTARRVLYKLSNAKAWHRAVKNNHPGQWRDESGKLQPLPPMRPIILHSSTLRMN